MRQSGGLGKSAGDRILQLALEHVPLGVSVWDEDKKLRFANDRYLEIYAFAPDRVPPGLTLEGMAVLTIESENHPGSTVEQLVEVFGQRLDVARASGKPVRTEKAIRGRLIATTCIFSTGLGWIVLHDDITEQTEQKWQAALTEKNLDTQSRRFNAALDTMSHGLAIFDANMRVVVCNQGYRNIYRLSDEVRPGMHLRRIAELRVAAGTEPTDVEDFVTFSADVKAPVERFVKTSQLRDGRYVEVTRSPLETGGYVAVHKDVTEEIARLDALEASNAELVLYKRRFEAALANMSHGLSLYDGDWRLVACNARYLELYSLSANNVRPGTPFNEIIRQRREAGAVPAGMDEDFEGHVLNTSDPMARQVQTYRLRTGRVIQVAQSPVEGGGFVAIHQDITEEVERLEALEASHAEIAVQKMRFEAALANISHGLSMYDSDGRLVIANERYREIYRAPAEALMPGNLYADLVARRDGPNGLKRIPESNELIAAVLGEVNSEAETIEAFRMGDNRVVSVLQSAMPDGGFIRTHQDITRQVHRFEQLQQAEREAAEQNATLSRQNMRFDAAINNMSQGLCMFDGNGRLVVCNEPYAHIYNLPPELMRPGTSLEQILEHRFAHGMVPKSGRRDYIEGRKRLVDDAIEAKDDVELEDGRTIFVHHRPMKDGGWVATHEDVTERRQMEARVRHLARHDPLTDLPNRAFLREDMGPIEGRLRRREPVAVLAIDLDHFKNVNDTLGHAIGDRLLVTVAERLRECARETDVVARLGGDEFAMFITNCEKPADAAAIAARVIKVLSRPMQISGHQVAVGASVGIALAPGDGVDLEALMRNADTALYRAKSEGRGNHHFFEQGMDDALQHRRMIEQGLRMALPRGEFRLVYQPQVNLSSNRICGFEALIRWDHPDRGTIPPSDFIPVAEETGLISAIGEWVLHEACQAAAAWPHDIRIAVNLSPAQFRNKGLVSHVTDALASSGLPAERLELEVTESLLLADTDQTLATLHELRGLGLHISMDDFGTGYSSLSYLRSFPFDKIKIDRSFVSGTGLESHAIIRAVVGLGQSLGMVTTAEGIETEEQLEAVRAQGCDEVQGFLFSPPLPVSAATALLESTTASMKAAPRAAAKDAARPRRQRARK